MSAYPLSITASTDNIGRPRQVVVQSAEEHKTRFPQDFAAFTRKAAIEPQTPVSLTHAEVLQVERSAKIAELHKNTSVGAEIAKRIRDGAPAPKQAWDATSDEEAKAKAIADAEAVAKEAEAKPESKVDAPFVGKEYPKLLSNPTHSPVKNDKFTVPLFGGGFAMPDVLVHTSAEEVGARSNGFSVEVPAPVADQGN
jgi:hypothetical protein